MSAIRQPQKWECGIYKKPGEMIRQGEVLGVVKDYEGRVLEVSRAEYDGVILYQTGSLQVKEGGPMIAYGKFPKSLMTESRKLQNIGQREVTVFRNKGVQNYTMI